MTLDRRAVFFLWVAVVVLATGCASSTSTVPAASTSTGPGKGHGPPPHAPAHGYRAKTHQGVAISWDSGLGVYVAVELSDTYYLEGNYYRYGDNASWAVSADINGAWSVIAVKDLPPGLQGKGKYKHKPKKPKN